MGLKSLTRTLLQLRQNQSVDSVLGITLIEIGHSGDIDVQNAIKLATKRTLAKMFLLRNLEGLVHSIGHTNGL